MRRKSKTVRQWIALINDPVIRKRAQANIQALPRVKKYGTMHDALRFAFSWEKSPEGPGYWVDIYHKAVNSPI